MLLALALAACAPHDDTAPADDPPAPYIYDEDDPPVADEDVVAIGDAVELAIDQALAIDASPVFDAYDTVMTGQSGACPAYYSDAGNTYWFDDCTSEEGAYFSGYGYTILYEDYPDPYSGFLYNGRGLYAAATVLDGAGHTFDGAGSAYRLTADLGAEHYDQTIVQGTFGWDGAGVDGTWLASGVSPDITVLAYTNADYDGHYVELDGGLSPLDAGDFVAVAFDTVQWMDENMGNTCILEPQGSISVRAADGGWYDVVFDGSVEAVVDPSVCDGCGTAFYRGEPLGEVCPDFSALIAASGAP
jgi:hypothetical protein